MSNTVTLDFSSLLATMNTPSTTTASASTAVTANTNNNSNFRGKYEPKASLETFNVISQNVPKLSEIHIFKINIFYKNPKV